jgi:signal transduction histidine kinase
MYIKLATRFFLRTIFIALLLVCFSNTKAQLQYNFERINTDNGLPTNAIKGLQFDEQNRFLWVATESGIIRYNGYGFHNFGNNEKTKVLDDRIVFFDKANNGRLFGKLIDERVFIIDKNKVIIDTSIENLVGQSGYLDYKYNLKYNSKKVKFSEIEHNDFIIDNQIFSINNNQFYRYNLNQFDTLFKIQSSSIGFVLRNRIFIFTIDGHLYEFQYKQNNKFNLIEKKLNLLYNYNSKDVFSQINIFQNHPNEDVYIIKGTKLYSIELNNGFIATNLITDQLPEREFVKYIQIDKITKTIYLGTDNRGMLIGKPKYFNRILPNNNINGISTSAYAQLQLKNGNIQINSGQIFGTSKNTTPNIFYKPSETATYISKDSILFMTNSDGIVEYDLKKNKIIAIQVANDLIKINRNYFIEINNTMYSFNESGVMIKRINDSSTNNWKYKLRFKKAPFNFIVYSLMKVNSKEILAATTDGLYKYNFEKNTFNLFYRDKTNANFRTISSVGEYFLIGTYGGGVYMYRNDIIKKLPLDQNMYLNYAHCFFVDKKNRVWASTNKGLFMSPVKSLIDFWEKGPGNIKFRYFGKPDGIDQLEFNGGCTPCAIELKNGDFSFPSIDGLIQFNPDKINNVNIQPNVYFDRILVDGKSYNPDQDLTELPSGAKNIEFYLGISGMLSQENIMLEYKIDDEKWSRINVSNPVLRYTNLSHGDHKLYIRVKNTIQDKWAHIEFSFNILYPWTLHPLMYFVYFTSIIILILLYIRFKTIIYQRRQKDLEKEVAIKTESLNKLNDYLLKRNQAKDHVIAIMNHDILTPLKYLHITAKNIVDSNNEQQIKSSIKQIANTSKELEYLTSNMLNWVKFDNIEALPKKQYIDLYILVSDLIDFVQPFIEIKNVELNHSIKPETIIDNWSDTLRVLLYNLIVNAIKATASGTIQIGYEQNQNGYTIYVNDTGIGMNESLINYLTSGNLLDGFEHINKFKSGNGVGYQIIRNVLNLMKANIVIKSKEHVGTSVMIKFTN